MPNKLLGWTHCIVQTTSREFSQLNRIYGYINVCFGPGDNDAIVGITWLKVTDKQYGFQMPQFSYPRDKDSRSILPVFKGQLAIELSSIAASAVEEVKKLGRYQHNKRYRVDKSGAVEKVKEGECPKQ